KQATTREGNALRLGGGWSSFPRGPTYQCSGESSGQSGWWEAIVHVGLHGSWSTLMSCKSRRRTSRRGAKPYIQYSVVLCVGPRGKSTSFSLLLYHDRSEPVTEFLREASPRFGEICLSLARRVLRLHMR